MTIRLAGPGIRCRSPDDSRCKCFMDGVVHNAQDADAPPPVQAMTQSRRPRHPLSFDSESSSHVPVALSQLPRCDASCPILFAAWRNARLSRARTFSLKLPLN